MWNDDDFVRRKENLPWQVMGESTLVLNPVNSSAHEFNGCASFIWSKLDAGLTYRQLLEMLCEEYEVSCEEAAKDLQEFLTELHEKELLA